MTPKISSAEWEVMLVVWSKEPILGGEVYAGLPAGHGWKQKTVNTFLARLVEKGVLAVDKKERAHVYRSRVAREKCIQAESDSFLQRVFQGAAGELVLHFCENADLKPEEIRELEQLLKARRTGK
ncbi:MAG TPA: BlaI/MecI/CopY family transcriptional regulator [Opitutaceae bacterium]|jgi:BlaI family penicillinase repressor